MSIPITITDSEGREVKFGRAGNASKSPLTLKDRQLIWDMVTIYPQPEKQTVVMAVHKRRQEEGLPPCEDRYIKIGVAWAERQINRDMESQKINTSESKRLKKVITSLIAEFEVVGDTCTKKLTENPDVFKEPWFMALWDRRLRLSEMILKYMDKAGRRRPPVDPEVLRRAKAHNPHIADIEKYKDRIPVVEVISPTPSNNGDQG